MITKTYHIITVDITQISDSIFNPNLSFSMLKQVHWIDQNRPNGQNEPNWTEVEPMEEVDRMDRNGTN